MSNNPDKVFVLDSGETTGSAEGVEFYFLNEIFTKFNHLLSNHAKSEFQADEDYSSMIDELSGLMWVESFEDGFLIQDVMA